MADLRSILDAAGAAPRPQPAGNALVVDLPQVPTRSLGDYAITSPAATGNGDAS